MPRRNFQKINCFHWAQFTAFCNAYTFSYQAETTDLKLTSNSLRAVKKKSFVFFMEYIHKDSIGDENKET